MKIQVKNVRVMKNSPAYECTLHVDGKKVAFVNEDGRGGELRIDWTPSGGRVWNGGEIEKKLIAHALKVQGVDTSCKTCGGTGKLPPKTVNGAEVIDGCTDCKLAWEIPSALPILIETLVNEHEDRKWLKRQCRTKTLYRLPDSPAGEWQVIKKPFTPALAIAIRVEHPDAIIGNEVIAS